MLTATITADSSLLTNLPSATPQQCATFMLRRPHGPYTDHDIANVIVPAYFAICLPVGLDPVVLIAQMIHETGNLSSWWADRPRRNPAGIGVTGRTQPIPPAAGAWQWEPERQLWKEGVAFATWREDAVPAHAGRLLAYVLPAHDTTPTQQALITRALTYRPLPPRYRGVAPTLSGLNGRWAVPGHDYADRLLRLISGIQRS